MKNRGLNAVIISLACLSVISLAGSSLGTLAWYAYTTRATVAYSGTAVQSTERLQIGLDWGNIPTDSQAALTFKQRHGVSFESVGDKTYCFMPEGSGFLSAAIGDYLTFFGHATTELAPITSKAYVTDGDFNLFASPSYTHAEYMNNPAEASCYVELPFVFRINTADSGTPVYAKNQNIWITDASVVAHAAAQDVRSAIRLHVENPDASAPHSSFILSPSSTTNGTTAVGGLLDLDDDGCYDYESSPTQEDPNRQVEILYGVNEESSRVPTLFNARTFEDINQTGVADSSHRTTFAASHEAGVYGYAGNYDDIEIDTANYVGLDTIKPHAVAGYFQDGYPIAKTSNDDNAIGETMITVWLEGWDHAIVDKNIGARFSLGLQFEINRV